MRNTIITLAVIALVGSLAATAIGDHDSKKWNGKNPFQRILDRLDDIEDRIDKMDSGGADEMLATLEDVQDDVSTLGTRIDDVASKVDGLDCLAPWSQTLANDDRFELVLNDEAVLDRETGLVWVRRPRKTNLAWNGVKAGARTVAYGDRAGWRIPSFEELATLVDVDAWLVAREANDLDVNSVQTLPSSSLFDLAEIPAGRVQFVTDTHDDSTEPGANDYVVYLEFTGTEAQSHFATRFSPLSNRGGYVWYVRGGSSYNGHEGSLSD